MYYLSNRETFKEIFGRCHNQLFKKEDYPTRYYSESDYVCLSKKKKLGTLDIYDGIHVKQNGDDDFVVNTFKGASKHFVLDIINSNKMTKFYYVKHPEFCNKLRYLMED